MKNSKLWIAIIQILLMTTVVLGIFFYTKATNVTVPFADVEYSTDQKVCQKFIDLELDCKVEEQVSEVVPMAQLIVQKPYTDSVVKKGTEVVLTYSKGPSKFEVPNYNGKTKEEVLETLVGRNIEIVEGETVDNTVFPEGLIVSTVPAEGETIENGGSITINTSSGKNTIPDFTGKNSNEVTAALKDLGFTSTLKQEESDKPLGTVLKQSLVGLHPLDSNVELIIAKKPEPKILTVPNIAGKEITEAEIILAEMGFKSIKTENADSTSNKIASTKPAAGEEMAETDTLTLVLEVPPPPSPSPSPTPTIAPSQAPTPAVSPTPAVENPSPAPSPTS